MRPAQRGRPPRACSEDNLCDMAPRARRAKAVATRTAETLRGKLPEKARNTVQKRRSATNGGRVPAKVASAASKRQETREVAPLKATKSRPEASPAVVHNNPSVPIARQLREQLEPLGWTCHATRDDLDAVNFIATRDSEVITVRIENGKVVEQGYSIWDAQRPSTNGQPKSRLTFDPEEMSDVELIRELMGQKVSWWNTISKKAEHAVIPHKENSKIKVEHVITWEDGEPDELPGSRVISFVDQTPNQTSFRAFRLGALLKIG